MLRIYYPNIIFNKKRHMGIWEAGSVGETHKHVNLTLDSHYRCNQNPSLWFGAIITELGMWRHSYSWSSLICVPI